MSVDIGDFINILAELCENKKMKVAVTESAKGALVTGCSTLIGGVVLGPVGLALGAICGGLGVALASKGKFQSVAIILKKMPQEDKIRIYNRIKHAVRNVGIKDIAALGVMILTNKTFQDIALKELTHFFNEKNLRIQ